MGHATYQAGLALCKWQQDMVIPVGLKADGSVVAKGNNDYTNGRSQYRCLPFVLPHMAILYKIELTPISIGV